MHTKKVRYNVGLIPEFIPFLSHGYFEFIFSFFLCEIFALCKTFALVIGKCIYGVTKGCHKPTLAISSNKDRHCFYRPKKHLTHHPLIVQVKKNKYKSITGLDDARTERVQN